MKRPEDDARDLFTVGPDEVGLTVLELLAERLFDIGTTDLRRLVRGQRVLVNERPAAEDRALAQGDAVTLELPADDEVFRIVPRPIEGFRVLYEDEAVVACGKPAGVAVISERADRDAPFLGAVLEHLLARAEAEGRDRPARPRVVHRIDKEASGVVLLAKNREAMRSLTSQFEERTVEKDYLALVRGAPLDDSFEIDLPIGPSAKSHGFRMRTGGREAKPAQTSFQVVERFEGYALLRVAPHTGRQHQIRVHLEAIGYPLAVDSTYGGETALLLSSVKRGYRKKTDREETPLMRRLSLHAARITFRSPARAEPVTVEAPLPHDFEVALKQLRKWAPAGRRRGPHRAV